MIKPRKLENKNFLSNLDINNHELNYILELADKFKNKKPMLTVRIKF